MIKLIGPIRTRVLYHFATRHQDVSYEDIDMYMVDSYEGHKVALQMQLDDIEAQLHPWARRVWRTAMGLVWRFA